MNESQISVRYARALFESASGQKVLDRVYRDMNVLAETCKLHDFRYMLAVPSLQPSQKCSMVDSILKAHISELSLALINLVIKNKREIYLAGIARNFKDLYRRAKGIRSASLITAQKVDSEVMDRIRNLIEKTYDSEVELSAKVNKNVIGGFVLTVEGQQYDASVATSLRKMKKQLLQNG
jgi:F-type H+-transporting ATPase subunit delta